MELTERMYPDVGFTKQQAEELRHKATSLGYKSFSINPAPHIYGESGEKEYPIRDMVYAYGIRAEFKFSKNQPKKKKI